MKNLLDAMLAALTRGERVALCTILQSVGSAPRGAGTHMTVFEDGTTLGTVGGGSTEYRATQRAVQLLQDGADARETYELTLSAAQGLVCGGEVTIAFKTFSPENNADIAALRCWREALDTGERAWLRMTFSEATTDFCVLRETELPEAEKAAYTHRAALRGAVYTEPLHRAGKVYVFGGGHVGQALVPVLAGIDFATVLYDNRPMLATPERFPTASAVICGEFTDIAAHVTLTADDYAIIMSPLHQTDFALLRQVLHTNVNYIGCLGSRRKIAAAKEQLLSDGFTEDDLSRVHWPIGLPIAAETPAEVAISIAAQLIEHRAKRAGGKK